MFTHFDLAFPLFCAQPPPESFAPFATFTSTLAFMFLGLAFTFPGLAFSCGFDCRASRQRLLRVCRGASWEVSTMVVGGRWLGKRRGNQNGMHIALFGDACCISDIAEPGWVITNPKPKFLMALWRSWIARPTDDMTTFDSGFESL